MARDNLTFEQIHQIVPSPSDVQEAFRAKLADHDEALDTLEASGGVGPGTVDAFAKFTGVNAVGDSRMSEPAGLYLVGDYTGGGAASVNLFAGGTAPGEDSSEFTMDGAGNIALSAAESGSLVAHTNMQLRAVIGDFAIEAPIGAVNIAASNIAVVSTVNLTAWAAAVASLQAGGIGGGNGQVVINADGDGTASVVLTSDGDIRSTAIGTNEIGGATVDIEATGAGGLDIHTGGAGTLLMSANGGGALQIFNNSASPTASLDISANGGDLNLASLAGAKVGFFGAGAVVQQTVPAIPTTAEIRALLVAYGLCAA